MGLTVAIMIIVIKTVCGPLKKMFIITVHGLALEVVLSFQMNFAIFILKIINAPCSAALEDQLCFSFRI